MAKFSVLIPVYNAERYLKECIDSVLGQKVDDFEVVLVDDGSQDASGQICDGYASRDRRIRVIHQENQGPTMARIHAFRESQGDFIIYMDSDDCWRTDLLERLNEAIQKYDCDIVSFRWRYMDADGKLSEKIPSIYPVAGIIDDMEMFFAKFFSEEVENCLWKRAVRRSCINGKQIEQLSAIQDIYLGEDMVQSFIMVKDCRNMVYLDDDFYFYRRSLHGLSYGISEKSVTDIAKAREYLWKIMGESQFNGSSYREMVEKNFLEHYLTDLVGIANKYDIGVLIKTASEVKKMHIYQSVRERVDKRLLSKKRRVLYYMEQQGCWRCFLVIARIYKKLLEMH